MKIQSDKVYFTSDTHYSHKNICRGITEWTDSWSSRDFPTLNLMDDAIVDGINSVVPYDGILFHMGDWSFGGIGNIAEFRRRLNVREIHLIFGNHDHHLEAGKEIDQFSSVQYYKEIVVNKHSIILFHYGMRVWHNSHKGSWHLYGHSHGSLPPLGRSMDVGVDTNNYKPYSFEEIHDLLIRKRIEFEDHHNVGTN